MFFYTALLIACVVAAIILVFLHRSFTDFSKVIYRALPPSAKTSFRSKKNEQDLVTTVNNIQTPWGWETSNTAGRVTRNPAVSPTRPTPWGWPGSDQETSECGNAKAVKSTDRRKTQLSQNGSDSGREKNGEPMVGWPYREEQFELASKSCEVTRKAKPKRANLTSSGKPWGW